MRYQNYMLDLRFEREDEYGKFSYCSCSHFFTPEEAISFFKHMEEKKDPGLVYAGLCEFKENRFFVSEKILLDRRTLV